MEYFNIDFKQYLKRFWWRYAIVLVLVIVFVASMITGNKLSYYDSPNKDRVYGSKRVFDYGNQLSTKEEEKLENYIYEAEKKTCLDIVIVTLNQSLKDYEPEYRAKYSIPVTPDKYVMVYADKFWEDNGFGYNCAQKLDGKTTTGDGVILVDNVYREDTGKIYTWMGTTGKAEEMYSSSMIDNALDRFYDYVESEYYAACIRFVDQIVKDCGPKEFKFSFFPLIVALIFMAVYASFALHQKQGVNTVSSRTYMKEGSQHFAVKEDRFVRSSVKKVYNPPSSSGGSGGGGHHSSGGGGSHGGGGHSR